MILFGHEVVEIVDNPRLGKICIFDFLSTKLIEEILTEEYKFLYAQPENYVWERAVVWSCLETLHTWYGRNTAQEIKEWLLQRGFIIGIELPKKQILQDILNEV